MPPPQVLLQEPNADQAENPPFTNERRRVSEDPNRGMHTEGKQLSGGQLLCLIEVLLTSRTLLTL